MATMARRLRRWQQLRRRLGMFEDSAAEATFNAHWPPQRRRVDTAMATTFAMASVAMCILSAAQADADAATAYPDGFAAAGGSVVAAAHRIGGSRMAAVVASRVQHLQAAVLGFAAQLDAPWTSRAAFVLLHAPQLLLHHVLLARNTAMAVYVLALVATAWVYVRQSMAPAHSRWRRDAMVGLACNVAWHTMAAMDLCFWPHATVRVVRSDQSVLAFMQASHSSLAAHWLQMYHRIGLAVLTSAGTLPISFRVQLLSSINTWVCSVVVPMCAACWLSQPSCSPALVAVLDSQQAHRNRTITNFMTAVVLAPALAWVLESRQRRAILLFWWQQQEQQERQQQQEQQQLGKTRKLAPSPSLAGAAVPSAQAPRTSSAAESVSVASCGMAGISSRNEGEVMRAAGASSPLAPPAASSSSQEQSAHLPAVLGSASASTSTGAAHVTHKQPPCQRGSALYCSPFKMITISMKVVGVEDDHHLPSACSGSSWSHSTSSHADADDTSGLINTYPTNSIDIEDSTLPSVEGQAATTTPTGAAAYIFTPFAAAAAVDEAAELELAARAQAAATMQASARAVAHASGSATQRVCSAIKAAVHQAQEQGELHEVLHTTCTTFPGCVHAILNLFVGAVLGHGQQQQVGQQALAASAAQVSQLGHVQASAVLPALDAFASGTAGSADGDVPSRAFRLEPVAVALDHMQHVPHQQQQQDVLSVQLCLPSSLAGPQTAAELAPAAAPDRHLPSFPIRVVATCQGTLLHDSRVQANNAGQLMLRILAPQAADGALVLVLVLMPASQAHTLDSSNEPAAAAQGAHYIFHANEVVLAQLPLLVLRSQTAAEELCHVFESMAQELQDAESAHQQHFVPFTWDLALALGYCGGGTMQQYAQDARDALLGYVSSAETPMPALRQLLLLAGRQQHKLQLHSSVPLLPIDASGQSSGSLLRSSMLSSMDTTATLDAVASSSTVCAVAEGSTGAAAAAVAGDVAGDKEGVGTHMQQAHAVPAAVSLCQAVWGFEDAQVERAYQCFKTRHIFMFVVLMAAAELAMYMMAVLKVAAITAQNPPAQLCLLVRAAVVAVDAAALLIPLFSQRWRQHRETIMVARGIAAMVAALGSVAIAGMRDVARRTYRQVLRDFWGLAVFRASAVPLTQQLTLQKHLLAMPFDTVRWGSMLWLLVPDNGNAVQFALVLACGNVMAALLALAFDWHWRTVFVRHAAPAAATQ